MRKYTRFLIAIAASVILASGPIMAQKSGSSKPSPASRPSSPSAPKSSGFSGSGGSRTPSTAPAQRPSQTSPITQRPSSGFSGSGVQRSQESARPQAPSRVQQPSQLKAPSGFSGSGAARPSVAVPGQIGSAPTKPNFDSAAGRAQSQQRSTQAYLDWKKAKGLDSKPFSPDLQKTRVQREETYYRNRQPTGYYRPPSTNTVVVYRDHYNDNFLMYMTPLWYYHHWNMLDRSRFQDQQIRDLESRMREYERQGISRNPNYIEPGTDPDLMYQQNVAYDAPLISQGQPSRGTGWFGKLALIVVVVGLVSFLVWFVIFRRTL